MSRTHNLIAKALDDQSGWELSSPIVGTLIDVPLHGLQTQSGAAVIAVQILNRPVSLIVPNGVSGWIDTDNLPPLNSPIEHGQILFTIKRTSDASSIESTAEIVDGTSDKVLCAPQAGRFYRRPDPESANYCEAGDELHIGKTVGLLEVMKTFNPVKYQASNGLPQTGTIKRFLVEDGVDVAEGEALLELG